MVNEGSGVLVNAMSDEYSYVLTAKHTLKNAENIVTGSCGEKINVIDVYSHSDLDCAVILIECRPDIQQPSWKIDSLMHKAPLILSGFPEVRRDSSEKIKHQDGHLTTSSDEAFIFTANGIPGKELITGMSGGGVYYIREGCAYLLGVEYSMDGEDESEHFGRFKCIGLSQFQEIFEFNNIVPMVPCFLESFSRLSDDIFGFNVALPSNVQELQVMLKGVAIRLINEELPAPYELMIRYGESLLLKTEQPSTLEDIELWIAYFEFIVICALLDDKIVDNEYIDGLERRRRIIHANSNKNWLRYLDEILKVAKEMLDEGGTIIVNSPQENADVQPFPQHLNKIIGNIAAVPCSGSFFEIDNTEEDIYRTFTITHLKGLRDSCVVKKEWEFAEADKEESLQLFRSNYNAFIK